MCVIIQRNPGVIIPAEKIESACHVNQHGFGFSVVDRGKIETIKLFEAPGNKPEKILKLLEDAKDQQVYLHLRFNTAGKTNTENCHPFESMKDGDFEVQFMHNGTLSEFTKTGDDFSDTYHFNKDILGPLLTRFYEIDGAGLLLNPLLKRILDKFKGTYSAFTLYDSEGNHLIMPGSNAKQFDGWWASNDYSFNRSHRSPTTNTYGGFGVNDDGEDNFDYWPSRRHSTTTSTTTSPIARSNVPACTTPPANKPLTQSEQCKKGGFALIQAKRYGVPFRELTPPTKRLTFSDMSGIHDLNEVYRMTEGDLYDLCEELPLAATALLMDLIHDRWTTQKKEELEKKKAAAVTTNNVTPIRANG